MKKQEIRDRLNESPISWDKEGVWAQIAAEEKRKQRLPFFWWGFGAFFLVALGGLSLFGKFYFGSEHPLTDEVNTYLEYDIAKASSELDKSNSSQTCALKKFVENESLKKEEISNYKVGLQNEVHRFAKNGKILNKAKAKLDFVNNDMNSDLSQEKSVDDSSDISTTNYYYSSDKITGAKLTSSINSKEQSKQLNENADTNRGRVEIKKLTSTFMANELNLEYSNQRLLLPLVHKSHSSNKKLKFKNEFQFSFGAVRGKHQFAYFDIYDRRNLEKNKSGISGGLHYVRLVSNNWTVNGGISLMMHKTNLNRVILSENQYVNSVIDNKIYLQTKETSYNYYNYYVFADIELGLGYQIKLGIFKITPVAGIGANLLSVNDGDVIDELGSIISLDKLYEVNQGGKIYYYGKVKISTDLGENYSLGIEAIGQSQRKVFSEQELHTIQPVLYHVVFSKKW